MSLKFVLDRRTRSFLNIFSGQHVQSVFYSSRSVDTSEEDASAPAKKKTSSLKRELKPSKKLSKCAFGDLPVSFKHVTQRIKPLTPWEGGLETSITPSHKENIKSQELLAVRRRRRTVRKSLALATEEGIMAQSSQMEVNTRDTVSMDLPLPIAEMCKSGSSSRSQVPRNQLAQEILENLSKFPNCILLTRVGSFYESYFDQAREVSQLLSIKLTKRIWDKRRVWMCGFPLSHLDKHLRILVQKYRRPVALCEEFHKARDPDSLNLKPQFERRVVRVLTPGTLIDESFLNPYTNNFLLSAKVGHNDVVGLAWIDVSTGEFFSEKSTLAALPDHLVRIAPQEVIFDERMKNDCSVETLLAGKDVAISYVTSSQKRTEPLDGTSPDDIELRVEDAELNNIFSQEESDAISLLTTYLQHNLMEHAPKTIKLSRETVNTRMHIDAHTLKSLEILENILEGGAKGSLLSTFKRTVTSSGTRLLQRWLCSPSTSIAEVKARQSLVELFVMIPSLREDVIECLRRTGDVTRVMQRFTLGRGDIDDFSSMKQSICIWKEIKERFDLEFEIQSKQSPSVSKGNWTHLNALIDRMSDFSRLVTRIENAVEQRSGEEKGLSTEAELEVEDGQDIGAIPSAFDAQWRTSSQLLESKLIWSIKPEFSPELYVLHERLKQLHVKRKSLEEFFQDQYNAPSLTLRSSSSQGIHVHLAKPRRDSERLSKSSLFMKIAESNSTRSYVNEASFCSEWSGIGQELLNVIARIYSLEREAFTTLRSEVISEADAIRRTAKIVDELDITTSFATLASELHLVKPIFSSNSNDFKIINGRHPSVEIGLLSSGRTFTPNSVTLQSTSRLHIITGPNMAGKSTFLRQVAILTILAQTGSFVPAEYAELAMVDRVFSRVGAKDDLFRDRSTFMVEMLETADILHHATEKSLVIMDEVGRGTTMTDGIALAFAVICHLYYKNKCRTLFATHFHELADMLEVTEDGTESSSFPGVKFFCSEVDETKDGRYAYSHRMTPGVNHNSHGLKVAQLAGMPKLAMDVATNALLAIKGTQVLPIGNTAQNELRSIGHDLLSKLDSQSREK